jgi:hypothetical protein
LEEQVNREDTTGGLHKCGEALFSVSTKYYWEGQIYENEMGGAYIMHEEMRNA